MLNENIEFVNKYREYEILMKIISFLLFRPLKHATFFSKNILDNEMFAEIDFIRHSSLCYWKTKNLVHDRIPLSSTRNVS